MNYNWAPWDQGLFLAVLLLGAGQSGGQGRGIWPEPSHSLKALGVDFWWFDSASKYSHERHWQDEMNVFIVQLKYHSFYNCFGISSFSWEPKRSGNGVGLPQPLRGPEKAYFVPFFQEKGSKPSGPLKFLQVQCSVVGFWAHCMKTGDTSVLHHSDSSNIFLGHWAILSIRGLCFL